MTSQHRYYADLNPRYSSKGRGDDGKRWAVFERPGRGVVIYFSARKTAEHCAATLNGESRDGVAREMLTADEFDAKVRADTMSYRIHLFLGRGEWDRGEAATAHEALALGDKMRAAHPDCSRRPMFYAIEPSGHSVPISEDKLRGLVGRTAWATLQRAYSSDCRD